MNLKFLTLSLILLSVLFAFPSVSRGSSIQSLGPGKMTYVIATVAGGPQTVDPAMAYDTASGELIQNVYDPLIFFKGTETGSFVPWLASSFSTSADGLTYEFVIRQNVPWQNASYGFVTPADVEYSFEKVLVRDFTGGPAWMFWFPIFGTFAADLSDPVAQGMAIENAITRDDVAGTVTLHLTTGEAYLPFLGILAQTWGSIVSRQWCIDQGDWNPDVDKLDDGTWVNAHDPVTSPLDAAPYHMMGSGPFKLNYLIAGISWSILRNPSFWGGWGKNRASLLGLTTNTRGYLDQVVEYFVSGDPRWPDGFTGPNPVYDSRTPPRQYISSYWQQPGIRCIYPLKAMVVDAMFFTYNVSMQSPFIGTPTNATYFGPNGIRPDFFSDVHARKAVAYSFNWSQFILSAYLGEAQQVPIPLPSTLPFYNASLPFYGINFTRAINEWQQAWGGQVWANGFRFSVVYNEGNTPRQTAAQILKTVLEAENPMFHVDVVSVPWNIYSVSVWHGGPGGRSLAPICHLGWLGDYPDADDWVTPFLQSTYDTRTGSGGIFGYPQHIDMDPYSALMDNLIEWGRQNATFEGRNANYQRLWQLYIQQAPSVPLEQAYGRHWERDWVQGWYCNPALSGTNFYTMWKEALPWEDINSDGKVDIKDLATAAKAFGAYFIQPLLPPNPTGPPGTYSSNWNSKVDVNAVKVWNGSAWITVYGDMKVDIKDLATIAKQYGYTAPNWQP